MVTKTLHLTVEMKYTVSLTVNESDVDSDTMIQNKPCKKSDMFCSLGFMTPANIEQLQFSYDEGMSCQLSLSRVKHLKPKT